MVWLGPARQARLGVENWAGHGLSRLGRLGPSGLVGAGLGGHRQVLARWGLAGRARLVPAGRGVVWPGAAGRARQAAHGRSSNGVASQVIGSARQGRHGTVRRGRSSPGPARRGLSSRGRSRQGRHGETATGVLGNSWSTMQRVDQEPKLQMQSLRTSTPTNQEPTSQLPPHQRMATAQPRSTPGHADLRRMWRHRRPHRRPHRTPKPGRRCPHTLPIMQCEEGSSTWVGGVPPPPKPASR